MSVHAHSLVLLTLLSATSLLGEQLVLPEGKEQTILCRSPAEINYLITWVANGAPIYDDHLIFTVGEERQLTGGEKGRNISFIATPDVNSTSLKCAVFDTIDLANSFEPLDFTIIVQGFLPAPDMVYTMREDSVLFDWTPPFSHDITDVEQDILHYVVTIFNMEDHSVLDTVNTTHTEYLLQSEECQFNEYQVEIAAVNVVGVGEKYTSPPITLQELTLYDRIVQLGGESPVIVFRLDTNCENGVNFDFVLTSSASKQQTTVDDVASNDQHTLTLQSSNIQFDERYNVSVTVDGASKFHYTFYLSTYDVENVHTTLTNNEYEIKCYFASGSNARGCRVVLVYTSEEGERDECELNATRQEETGEAVVNIQLPEGEYSLLVYDVDDNEGAENPAFISSISSTSTITPDTGCFARAAGKESPEPNDAENKTKVVALGVGLSLLIVAVVGLLVVLTVILCVRKHNKVSGKPRVHHESGHTDKEENEYIDTESFLRTGRPQTETAGSTDSSQQVNIEASSLASESRESTAFQHSLDTTDTQLSLSTPDSFQFTHSQTETPYSGEYSSSEAESGEPSPQSTTSTTPLTLRESNYVQVQHVAQQNLQSPPRTYDSVVYATIVPQPSPPPQTATTDEPPQ